MHTLNKNAPIGFFDSGVGGLTVLKQVKAIMPNESFIIFGDTVHVPYGDKTKEELLSYSTNILKFFESKGVKAVVMACNTTSSVVYDDIKDKYGFKIYPLAQSCAKILSQLNVNRMGVFATKATIESHAYEKEIEKHNPNIKVIGQYCPQWVKIVENNLTNTPESIKIVKNDLDNMMKNNPEKIILGCTHYPYLVDVLSKFAPKELFIDPASYFAQFIKNDLADSGLLCDKNERFEEFYVSSSPEKFALASKLFYDLPQSAKEYSF